VSIVSLKFLQIRSILGRRRLGDLMHRFCHPVSNIDLQS
jgi:hypothetical protein